MNTLSLGKLIDFTWNTCSYIDDPKYKNVNKLYILINMTI